MRKIGSIDATPPKNIFKSIIADYSLNLGICELIDNAIDLWTKKNRSFKLSININLNTDQKKITIKDNSGGIKHEDIVLFVSPGRSGNTGVEEIIGIFGVGSKRALVALAQEIKMTTRYENEKTLHISFNNGWLEDESWHLDVFEATTPIDKNSTEIELLALRFRLDDLSIAYLKEHLSITYAKFLELNKIEIIVNREPLDFIVFDTDWAYPPDYLPSTYKLKLPIEGKIVNIEITGGLTKFFSGEEYGVYFYCNDRLIARAMRDFEVGFTTGKAGQPHPTAALMRVIITIKGEAQFMPWNSSKSAVNTKHPLFEGIRDNLIQVVSYYSSLSRRLHSDWPNLVFQYDKGSIQENEIEDLSEISNIYNIPLPKARHKYEDVVKKNNRVLAKNEPWITGLYESMVMSNIISKQRLTEKNRFALLILDSNIEIAFKEYLVRKSGETYSENRLKGIFKDRSQVHAEVKRHTRTLIPNKDWTKFTFYYDMRCKLVHERAFSGINDEQIEDFYDLCERTLKKLFKINFDDE